MRIMRSWMFVPGHQQRMIDKAYGLKLDVAMFDLEDGVPPAEKNTARTMMPETLARPSPVKCSVSFVFIPLEPKK